MKVLIVDGNEKSASDRYTELGMLTQYEVYKKVLENIADIELDIIVIHPANFNDFLPTNFTFFFFINLLIIFFFK